MKQIRYWLALAPACVLGLGCSAADVPRSEEEADLETLQNALTGTVPLDPQTEFHVPPPNPGAVQQALDLVRQGKLLDALRIAALATTPHGVWFTGGTPAQVKRDVKKTMKLAKHQKRQPILVAYNLPFRDCAQYSGGGAVDTQAYQAWIDAFAAGIGDQKAIVILEPDGLGIIPYNTTIFGASEWCQPTVIDAEGTEVPAPGASMDERYAQLQYAVSAIQQKAPNASIYLDGTHGAWLGVSEAAYRLYRAGFKDGVQQVQGFYLNASNYRSTAEATQFGTWVSMCLTAGTPGIGPDWMQGDNGAFMVGDVGPHFDWCAGQYDPATGYTEVNYSPEFAAGVTGAIEGLLGGAAPATHFVIDTSRNGKGPLDHAAYAEAPYNQPDSVITGLKNGSWCNPPGSGLGVRPTANTGNALVDAYLWIKVPGESDGTCDTAGGARAWDFGAYNPWDVPVDEQSHFDPLWGMVDPAAGDWFPEQALELAKLAEPPLF